MPLRVLFTRDQAALLLFLAVILMIGLSVSGCAGATTTTESVATDDTATVSTTVEVSSTSTAAEAAPADAGDSTDYSATSPSYTSAGTSVTINTVTMGTGRDTVTYYVADIRLAEGTHLESAFSSGEYGGKAEDTSEIALANKAIVAINGDYYSARDDGVIIRNGVLYRDDPARTGLAIYADGTMQVYDETKVSAEDLLAAGVWNTYSFGPALLVDGDIVEGIDSYEADPGARHGIQGENPRTGVGIMEAGHFVFVIVDGRDVGYSRGVTLTEFAQIFKDLGCTCAYNLDGGGSSTLYFMGEVVNEPSQERGERSVSDILFVG